MQGSDNLDQSIGCWRSDNGSIFWVKEHKVRKLCTEKSTKIQGSDNLDQSIGGWLKKCEWKGGAGIGLVWLEGKKGRSTSPRKSSLYHRTANDDDKDKDKDDKVSDLVWFAIIGNRQTSLLQQRPGDAKTNQTKKEVITLSTYWIVMIRTKITWLGMVGKRLTSLL